MAYNMETILAEKLESMVARQEQTTRMKDYYDLYLFDKVQQQNINFEMLKAAVITTANFRNTSNLLPVYAKIITKLRNSEILSIRWQKYSATSTYSQNLSYQATCDAALDLVQRSGL